MTRADRVVFRCALVLGVLLIVASAISYVFFDLTGAQWFACAVSGLFIAGAARPLVSYR